MRTEEEAELDGFLKGIDVQLTLRFWTITGIAIVAWLFGLICGWLI